VRLLIIQLGRIGDAIWTGHLINRLSRLHPGAEVACLGSLQAARFLGRLPQVSRVSALPEPLLQGLDQGRALGPEEGQLLARCRQELSAKGFELTFNLNQTRAALTLLGLVRAPGQVQGFCPGPGGRGLAGQDWHLVLRPLVRDPARHREHFFVNMVDLLLAYAPAGPGPASAGYTLDLSPSEEAFAEDLAAGLSRPWAVIHLGAATPDRRWPLERFARLVRGLGDRGVRSVLVGGTAERERAAELEAELSGREAVNLAGQTSLGRLAALLKRADLFVGADSGPIHLAALMGPPAVGLYWGEAWPPETGPYTDKACCLSPTEACYPACSDRRPDCPARCRGQVQAEPVLEAALACLAGRPPESLEGQARLWLAAADGAGRFFRPAQAPAEPALSLNRLAVRLMIVSVLVPDYAFRPADAEAWGLEPGSDHGFDAGLNSPGQPASDYWAALVRSAGGLEERRFLNRQRPRLEANLQALAAWLGGTRS